MAGVGHKRLRCRIRHSSFVLRHSLLPSMPDLFARIADNVAQVRGRIAAAAARSGRAANDVTLVAVTKYVSAEVVRPLVAAGCIELGESRPQQLWEKAAAVADLPIRWHLIGHLQRNKVRRTLPLVAMIHSVDSPRLLAAIDEERGTRDEGRGARDEGRGADALCTSCLCPLPVLLEVNISGEAAKSGLAPETVEPLLAELANCRNVAIRGLMCMAGLEGGLDAARRDFARLRELRDRLRPHCPPAIILDHLSMGMSGDFEVAIEEGATIVRVGSALFEGVVGSRQ
jgi:PLP dependent protein